MPLGEAVCNVQKMLLWMWIKARSHNQQTSKWAARVERVAAYREMRNKFSFMSVTSIVAAIFIFAFGNDIGLWATRRHTPTLQHTSTSSYSSSMPFCVSPRFVPIFSFIFFHICHSHSHSSGILLTHFFAPNKITFENELILSASKSSCKMIHTHTHEKLLRTKRNGRESRVNSTAFYGS